jgi:hypothetical protein
MFQHSNGCSTPRKVVDGLAVAVINPIYVRGVAMAFSLSKSIVSAASAGLMVGALAACGGATPAPEAPAAEAPAAPAADGAAPAADGAAPAADAAGAKECCKGKNECKGKGACKTDANACAGKNECKGKGGCNGHCPK